MLNRILAQVAENEVDIPRTDLSSASIASVLQVVFGVAGGITLIILTIAGFKYVLSQGDPGETTKAKNTIMYALIGLVVCISAFSIVTFVLKEL